MLFPVRSGLGTLARRGLRGRIWSRELAQGLVEYAIILMLVALVVLVILGVFGTQISNLFSRVTSAVAPY